MDWVWQVFGLPFRFPKELFILLICVVLIGGLTNCEWLCDAGSWGIEHSLTSWANRFEFLVGAVAKAFVWLAGTAPLVFVAVLVYFAFRSR